jgi:hypothetical protein
MMLTPRMLLNKSLEEQEMIALHKKGDEGQLE